MVDVKSGQRSVRIDDVVIEAIARLGFFRSDAASFLAERVSRQWGGNDWQFMMEGERIAPLADKPRFQISREVWSGLTDKGRSDPRYACKATRLRIAFNVRRLIDQLQEPAQRTMCERARFVARGEGTCDLARSRDGVVAALTGRRLGVIKHDIPLPALPWEGCSADWCPCRWDFLPGDP